MKVGAFLVSRLLPCLIAAVLPAVAFAVPVAPVTGTQSFATLACRYAGKPDELAPIGDLDAFYGVGGGGPGAPGTVDHYWREVSFGTVNLAESAAFGWFNLPKTKAIYDTDADWQATLPADCIAAAMAADPSFDPHAYSGLITIVNDFFPLHPGVGPPQPAYGFTQPISFTLHDGSSGDWRLLMLSQPSALAMSSYTHEIGHTFGLRHSRRPDGVDYGNPWDLMSSGSCPPSDDACVDVHPIAYHKASVGWIPAGRKVTAGTHGSFTADLLAHHTLPGSGTPGALMIEIETGRADRILTVEARVADPASYDGILPDSGVILHRVDDPYTTGPHIRLQANMQPPPNEFAVDVDSSVYTVGESYSASIGPIGILTVAVDAPLGPPGGPATGYAITVTLTPPPPFAGCAPPAQTQISETECEALVALATMATTAPADWVGSALPCSWTGIFCIDADGDGQMEVTELDMGMPGPWAVTFTAGETLFQDLPHLRILDMRLFEIDGFMPDSVYGLTELRELHARGFQGPISPAIGNLTNLEWIGFYQARFTGTLPPEIGTLANLERIYFNRMPNITGILPPELANIPPVRFMFFRESDLCVPDDPALIAWLGDVATLLPEPADWVYCRETDTVMVLDDTASMEQPAGDGSGNSKIQSLRNAISMFTDILAYRRAGMGDRVGAVAFKVPPADPRPAGSCGPFWGQELVPMTDLDAGLPLVEAAAAGLPADGIGTPLRAGIQAGSDLLAAGAPGRRRLMLLVSDGKQNTAGCYIGPPYALESVADFKQSAITDRDIELVAVGLGSGGQVDAALMSDLATDGYYDSATSTIELNKWFTQALSEALQDTIVLDPEGTLAPGDADTHPVLLTGDSRSVTFVLSWPRRTVDLDLSLRLPDGSVIGLAQARDPTSGVRILSGPTYRAIVVHQPLGGKLAGKAIAGQWQAVAHHPPASQQSAEPYQLVVMEDSGLRMETGFASGPVLTGGQLGIRAALSGVREAHVVARVFEPVAGVGSVLAELGIADEEVLRRTEDMGADTDMLSRRIRLLVQQGRAWPVERTVREVTLYDDGRHGDGEPGDGVYAGTFGPVTADGVYSVLVRAEGTSAGGQPFQREFRRGIHARVDVSAAGTEVEIDPGGEGTRLVVTPRDANGLLLGPGYAWAVSLAAGEGAVSDMEDLGNGSYTATVALVDSGQDGQVEVSVFGTPLRILTLAAPQPASPWPWVLAAGLAALLVVVFFWKRKTPPV